MVLDHKTIPLYGKVLLEKAVMQGPVGLPNPMPNEACFLYILEGTQNVYSEQDSDVIKKNEAVLMKCGYFFGQWVSESDQPQSAIAVHFYPEVLKKVYENELPGFLKDHNYTFDANMVRVEASILVKKYIDSLLFYFENPELVSEDILILKLKEIILLLLQTENAPRVIEIFSNLFSERTFSFKEVIEAHIFSNLTLPGLAELTNMSLSSFKREFKKIYGEAPASYIKNRRLDKAANLIRVSDQSISHIAYDCGFNDLAHFSKSFKARFDTAPSEFKLASSNNSLS